MMNTGYNSNYQIVQAPGYVMILSEMIHDARVIPLDGRASPPDGMRRWVGLSRGRWEGETLVVETGNFNGKNPFRGSSDQMRVTERFTPVGDGPRAGRWRRSFYTGETTTTVEMRFEDLIPTTPDLPAAPGLSRASSLLIAVDALHTPLGLPSRLALISPRLVGTL